METQLGRSILLAMTVHRGMQRRGGAPYLVHNYRVASNLETDVEKSVAWLHDVVETGKCDMYYMVGVGGIFDCEIINAVSDLTHLKTESYMEYIEKLSKNPLAVRVKIADIYDNLTDKPSERQLEKYYQALQYLAGRK